VNSISSIEARGAGDRSRACINGTITTQTRRMFEDAVFARTARSNSAKPPGLQLVAGLLSSQSRIMPTLEESCIAVTTIGIDMGKNTLHMSASI
jgi:hypothetical protein